MADLESLGFHPFLSSGSLLGAIRNGSFLPHDDDIDLGNVTDTQHPAALILESERLERALVSRGYTVVRHSHAHLQLVFLHKSGDLDHYIDVFTAYFDPDGAFNQPFSIRGELAREDLEPYSVIELEGNTYAAPAVPQKWLELNYGPGWRVPDPGFQFEIPEDTRRRFDSWFGTFNLHRDYWEAHHADAVIGWAPDLPFVLKALSDAPSSCAVADIGAGVSGTATALRNRGWEAIAADFSLPALYAQRHPSGKKKSSGGTVFLNLNDRHSTLEFALDRIVQGTPTNLVLEHVLEGLGGDGKANAFLLMRWLLHGGTVAAVTFDTDLPVDHTFDDPTSWHLPLDDFRQLAAAEGLVAEVVSTRGRTDERGRARTTAYAIVRESEGVKS
ncbi:LicD family protein [Rathayibacter sp. CAU 1779]